MKDHRTTRALAAAALALALGACDDMPTGTPPRIAPAGQPAHNVSPSGATLIPNTVKYLDTGGKPARGRAGSAALEVFALLGKDGRTDLEYRALPANPWDYLARPNLERAQVKALDGDGTVMFTFNENHLNTYVRRTQFGSMAPGQSLQVQANITGIDPHRTDVVTVTQRVMMRPDLSVRVQAPSRIIAGKPVPLHATISELNGEVGAQADCRLLVDGTQQDAASGVWINAGGVVTCGFSHAFSPGVHQVQVEVTGVSPDDWDEANNLSAAVEVNAVAESAGFYYFASAAAVQVRYDHTWRSRWYNPSTGMRGEYGAESGITVHTEGASMHGYIDRLLFGEVSLEVSQSSGGRLIHSDAWTDFAQDGTLCTSRHMQSTAFFLCSYRSGSSVYTSFTYHHYAGTVTYHSREYAREWDDVTGDEIFYYDYNETFVDDKGPRLGFGDDYAFHVRVAAGDMVLTADSRFLLERLEVSTLDEYCYTDAEWWDGYRSERCVADLEVGTHRHGYDEYYGG